MPFIKVIPAEFTPTSSSSQKSKMIQGSKTVYLNASSIGEVVRSDYLPERSGIAYDKRFTFIDVTSKTRGPGSVFVMASPAEVVRAIATALRDAHHDAVDCPMQKDPPEDPPAEKEPEAAPTD